MYVDDVFNLLEVGCDTITGEDITEEFDLNFAKLTLAFVESESTLFEPLKDCFKGVIVGTLRLAKYQDVVADVEGSWDAFEVSRIIF